MGWMGLKRIAVGAALLAATGSAFAGQLSSVHLTARQKMTSSGQNMSQTFEIWFKGGKSRFVQGKLVVVTDGKNRYMYRLNDPKKEMMVMPVPAEMRNLTLEKQVASFFTPEMKKKAKKIGKATFLKHPTTIYQVPQGKDQMAKVWVAEGIGNGLPLKAEIRSADRSMDFEMTKLEINPKLSDSLFKAPAGYKKASPPKPPTRPK